MAPTLAALARYACLGHTEAFLYANFLSIGDRSGASPDELLYRLSKAWKALHIPLFAVVLAAVLEPWRRFTAGPATFGFALIWPAAAVGGYLVFGT